MSDLLLAILLLVGGAAWTIVCFVAYANHPTPSQAKVDRIVYAGPIAFVIGFVWLGYIVLGWLA